MNLPTLETLASLAATMAQKTDRPEDSAKRAIHLWQACEKELHVTAHSETVKSEAFSEIIDTITDQDLFLSKCMGNPIDCSLPIKGKRAPFKAVLAALMAESKDRTQKSDWKAYREFCLSDENQAPEISEKKESFVNNRVREQVEKDEIQGFLETDLLGLRENFSKFREANGAFKRKIRSEKGVRGRSIRGISRKFTIGEKLTSEEEDVLKTLTDEEVGTEIKKLEMTTAQALKWKALVQDLNTPVRARPRVIRKNGAE